MKMTGLTRDAVNACLLNRIPFVLYALPGEDDFKFYASPVGKSGRSEAFADPAADCFFINFFDNDEPYTPGLSFTMDAASLLSYCEGEPAPQPLAEIRPRIPSTFRASYHDAFSRIIPRLKAEGGKVVLSRHRTILTTVMPVNVAEDFFSLTDTTFRYMAYTPETGLWIGSTPDLLLESDSRSREVRTMALAGTRPSDDDTPWDDKNIYEQSLVTDFIAETLKKEGLDVTVDDLSERRFINIKHLCTEITARGADDIPALLSELSPTPAVAGYPRDEAIEEISRYETHRRNCYGGYVGVRTGDDYHAYVNLRCCFMAPVVLMDSQFGWLCNLYAGGGIVAASKEEEEWNETGAKTAALASILLGRDSSTGHEGPELNSQTVRFIDSPMEF